MRCLEHHGGEVHTGKRVKRILVESGQACGVELASGETIEAGKALIGTIHPRLLGNYVDGLEPHIHDNARRMHQSGFSQSASHFALSEEPRYHADDAANAFIIGLAPERLESFRRAFDSFRYGEIPEHLLCSVLVNSHHDATRSPQDQAAMTIWTHLPFCLKNKQADDWGPGTDALHQRVIDNFGHYSSNIDASKIIASMCETPVDMQRSSPTFLEGDNVGTGAYFYQFGGHRPTPELAQYAVPGVKRTVPGRRLHASRWRCLCWRPCYRGESRRRPGRRFHQSHKLNKEQTMKLYSPDGNVLMDVATIETEEDRLIIKGKIMGTMPMVGGTQAGRIAPGPEAYQSWFVGHGTENAGQG